ncbi:MAG: glycoside hydrolase family 88 protein [Pseudomonadota bacterium]
MDEPFKAAETRAIDRLLRHAELLGNRFPDDTTVGQYYRLRQTEGERPGTNMGWTTGFWTGLAWLGYESGGRHKFRHLALSHLPSYARRLARNIDLDHHDLGFLYGPSCVAAYRATGLSCSRKLGIAAADWLMGRYLPNAGVFQAWGRMDDAAESGRIIIDTVMNLPLLHWAAEQSGDVRYTTAAVRHLQRSMDLLVRADGSSFHSYHLDPFSGRARIASTVQGSSTESCWARGQAWGIYGYALNHRYAPELGMLDCAIRMADYFLAKLPEDGIAAWDLSLVAGAAVPRDSSATAIAVCGLLEITNQMPDGPARTHFLDAAQRLLRGLITHCTPQADESNALLLHGVYSLPHGRGIDEANLWGDYYYLEALARVNRGWRSYWHVGSTSSY